MILSSQNRIISSMSNQSKLLYGMELLSFPTIFEDNRGEYNEIFNSELLKDKDFFVKQVSIVRPIKNSLRGFHGDIGTSKVVSVLSGIFFIAIVDPRKNSPTYGHSYSCKISSNDKIAIYIPPGLGNGFLSMSNDSEYLYLQNTLYGEFDQFTIRYSDPLFNITWPKCDYIISDRDINAGEIEE